MVIEVIVEAGAWDETALLAWSEAAEAALFAVLALDSDAYEAALLAADDARIAALNGDFRDKPQPTNVLSWPSVERGAETPGEPPARPLPGPLGDIALAFGVCAREASAAGKPFGHHVTHLIVHGLLHLLGYDHQNERDAALMEGVEIEALASLGIGNPYYRP
ncbi:MAG: rRNA maturation RNase YbeY [Pseudomonadota bacterium]